MYIVMIKCSSPTDYKISIIGKAVGGIVHILIDYSEPITTLELVEDEYVQNVDCDVDCGSAEMVNMNSYSTTATRINLLSLYNSELYSNDPTTLIVSNSVLIPKSNWKLVINGQIRNQFAILGGIDDPSPSCIFKSCCGYGTIDNDDTTLTRISSEDYEIMFHIGNQIYSDYIFANWQTSDEKLKTNVDYWKSEYRDCYRTVFGSRAMQRIFSKGIHFMMGDDHDQNFHDLNYQMHTFIDQPIAIAARSVLHEYQMSLWWGVERQSPQAPQPAIYGSNIAQFANKRDNSYGDPSPNLPIRPANASNILEGSGGTPGKGGKGGYSTPPNLFLKFSNTQFIILDNRYMNVYHHDPSNPFMGTGQIDYMHNCIQQSTKNRLDTVHHSSPIIRSPIPPPQYSQSSLPQPYNNIIVTSLPILANSKTGSRIKNFLDKTEIDDSTFTPNCANTIHILRKMSQYSKHGLNNIWIAGDLHYTSQTDIVHKRKRIFKQIVTSGVSKGCTVGPTAGIIANIWERCHDAYKLGPFSGENIKRAYTTNYLKFKECIVNEDDYQVVVNSR
jgi:hypothetical protein